MFQRVTKVRKLLYYISDIHLERGYKNIMNTKHPYLLLAGDIGYPKQEIYKEFLLNKSQEYEKVFILTGNHEYDNSKSNVEIEERINNICEMRNNLFFLQEKTIILDEVNKIKLSGCTLFSELPKSKNKYFLKHSEWLKKEVDNDKNYNYIIATHHCPSLTLINKNNYKTYLPRYFVSEQYDVYSKNNVFMWIYGHTHHNYNAIFNETFFTSNQFGYYKKPLKNFRK